MTSLWPPGAAWSASHPSLCALHLLFSPPPSPRCPSKAPGTPCPAQGLCICSSLCLEHCPWPQPWPPSFCSSFITLRPLPQPYLCSKTLPDFPVLNGTRQPTCFPSCFAFPQRASQHGTPCMSAYCFLSGASPWKETPWAQYLCCALFPVPRTAPAGEEVLIIICWIIEYMHKLCVLINLHSPQTHFQNCFLKKRVMGSSGTFPSSLASLRIIFIIVPKRPFKTLISCSLLPPESLIVQT